MKRYTTAEAREHFADIVNEVAYTHGRVVVMRRNKPMVAIMPIDDFDYLEELEEKIDLDDAKEALRDYKNNGGVSWTKLKKELGL